MTPILIVQAWWTSPGGDALPSEPVGVILHLGMRAARLPLPRERSPQASSWGAGPLSPSPAQIGPSRSSSEGRLVRARR
jgi:hypothetical protein